MAKNDIKIVSTGGYLDVPVFVHKVQDTTSSSSTQILAGEPVKISGAESGNYVLKLATGDPEIGTDIVVGIAKSNSTETSTADGTVDVYMPLPGVVYRCDATTAGNIDTEAEALLLRFDTVTFDLTSTTYTVDEDEGSDENVHGLRMLDFDVDKGTVDFIIKEGATMLGNLVA